MDGGVARQLQGQQGGGAVGRRPLQLADRAVAEEEERAAEGRLAVAGQVGAPGRVRRRERERDPEGDAGAGREEAAGRRGRRRDLGRRVDGERVAASPLQDRRAPQEAAERRHERGQVGAPEGQRLQPSLQGRRLLVERRAPVDEPGDDAPLQRGGVRVGEAAGPGPRARRPRLRGAAELPVGVHAR